MNTLLYLTDNSLEPEIADFCRSYLLKTVGTALPIISVSQERIDLGFNVCMGKLGRSWMSFYKQILAGLDVIKTGTVVIIEHDCLYSAEYLNWQPPAQDTFYYNKNHWLVQWHGNHPELEGMYSYWPNRTAFSQLICQADLLRQSTEEVLRLLEMGLRVERGLHWYGEPGVVSEQFRQAFVEASSGRPTQLQRYLKEYITHYRSEFFETKIPNLDIRHHSNFTGPKRGNNRTWNLPPWGEFARLIQ